MTIALLHTTPLLNTGDRDAHLELTIFYAGREPVGPYTFTVAARRVRHVRVNDLIDPEPVPYDTDYGVLIRDVAVVLSYARLDSRRAEVSQYGAIGFSDGP
ncbi:MAG: sensory rhodopsin transducer [Actinomycetota bacterium]|nr:sensory rhodopsin transducer [Actinomycetota bacterium]